MSIVVVVDDLIFLSKIEQTASLTNTRVEAVAPRELAERLSKGTAAVVICDLNHRSGLMLDIIRSVKQHETLRRVPILGFVSHVQTDLIENARQAGCDVIMARSAFTLELPQILREYSAHAAPSFPLSPVEDAQ